MRAGVFLLVALLFLPAAHATWYYAGDTWTSDGVVYSVEGSDHTLVLLSVGTQRFIIPLAECVRNGLSEYCYVNTAYPSDDDHMKYEAGEVYYGYDISIDEVTPDVSVTTEIENDEPKLNEEVTVTVTIKNDGEYRITNPKYDVLIPSGLITLSGPTSNKYSWTKTVVSPGTQERFTYRVKPLVYGSYDLKPTLQFGMEGATFNESVGTSDLSVSPPVTIVRYLTSTMDAEKTGSYSVNVTNDEDHDVDVTITIGVPSGITVTNPQGVQKSGTTYTLTSTLKKATTARASFTIAAAGPGDYRFPLTITTTSDGVTSAFGYNDTISVTGEGLTPSLSISPGKTTYPAGSAITISAALQNENDQLGFKTVTGALESGLFAKKSTTRAAVGTSDKVTLFSERVLLPNVTNQTTYSITFSGAYESVGGKRFEYTTQKSITVAPIIESVHVTQALSPATPERGKNVTVTVTAKNVRDTYLVLDAHERLPPGVSSVGGLTYAESSLEKSASQQLYIYQLFIPVDYQERELVIATVVRVQDESESQEFETRVAIPGEPPAEGGAGQTDGSDPVDGPVPTIDTDGDGIPDAVAPPETGDGDGFFVRAWNWLKGWFD